LSPPPIKRLVVETGAEVADRVEIAESFLALTRGLLGRSSLPAGEGICLVGCWNIHMFGMKFPIDVIYIDARRRVLKTVEGLAPWRISACPGAHSTIELGAGSLARTPVAVGDRLDFAEPSPPE
jgi:uncharacterized membrane protein (UPF0127 family)